MTDYSLKIGYWDIVNKFFNLYGFTCLRCGGLVDNKSVHFKWHYRQSYDVVDLAEINLPVRVYNALRRYGVQTVEEVALQLNNGHEWDQTDNFMGWLYNIRGIGFKSAEAATIALRDWRYTVDA